MLYYLYCNVINFKDDLNEGEFGSLVKTATSSKRRISLEECLKVCKRFSDVLESFKVFMRGRLHGSVDKVLSKYMKFYMSVAETKNSTFKAFNKTLPNILFPVSCFFGELFCFDAFYMHVNSIGIVSKKDDFYLYDVKPHYGNVEESKYLYEKVYLLKCLILFTCNTLKSSSVFLKELNENIDYEFFDALNDIILKISETMRYDTLTLVDMLEAPIIDESSIGAPDGDIYNNLKNHIWRRPENFGGHPNWDVVRKLREENARS